MHGAPHHLQPSLYHSQTFTYLGNFFELREKIYIIHPHIIVLFTMESNFEVEVCGTRAARQPRN